MTMDSVRNDAPARFDTRQRLLLVLLCGTQFMLALDFSILSVSLPRIGDDLHFRVKDLQWIITAFALPSGGLLLLFGRAADLYGRRRWYLAGMALFTASSLVGGLAVTPGMLLAARAGQGLASAMLTPAAMSLLTISFPEGKLRARALGINGTLLSLGFLIGVVLGGVITDLTSWRTTLFINVPLGALALVGASTLIRESRNEDAPRLDVAGAIAVTGGLVSLIFGITSGGRVGWGDPVTVGTILAGAFLLAAFLLVEARTAMPLIDLRILRRRTVIWGNLTGLTTFSMVTGVVFLLTLYMQQVRGMSPLDAGFSFAALGATAVIGGLFVARVIGRLGVQRTLALGLFIQALSTFALLGIRVDGGLAVLLVATGVLGFGHVFAVVGYMVTSTSGVPDEEQGMATGLTYTAQQLGLTIGTPILSTVAASRMGSAPTAARIVDGTHLGVLVDAIIVTVALVVALTLLRPRPAPAAPVTEPTGIDLPAEVAG